MKVKLLSRVRLLVTPWTAAYQAPPFMGFSRQEYWSGLPLPSPVMGVRLVIMLKKKGGGGYRCRGSPETTKINSVWSNEGGLPGGGDVKSGF